MGELAPPLDLLDIQGRSVDLSSRAKPVALVFMRHLA